MHEWDVHEFKAPQVLKGLKKKKTNSIIRGCVNFQDVVGVNSISLFWRHCLMAQHEHRIIRYN